MLQFRDAAYEIFICEALSLYFPCSWYGAIKQGMHALLFTAPVGTLQSLLILVSYPFNSTGGGGEKDCSPLTAENKFAGD